MDPNFNEFDKKDFQKWEVSRRSVLMGAGAASAALVGGKAFGGLTNLVRNEEPERVVIGSRVFFKDPSATKSNYLSLVPTPRNQTVIIDQGVFSVYDSFNPLIPNGEQYQAGVTQLAKEFLFYLNMATGKLEAWQGESWSYNSSFTQCTLKIKPNITWSDGKPFTSADIAFTTELMKKNQGVIGGGCPTPRGRRRSSRLRPPTPRRPFSTSALATRGSITTLLLRLLRLTCWSCLSMSGPGRTSRPSRTTHPYTRARTRSRRRSRTSACSSGKRTPTIGPKRLWIRRHRTSCSATRQPMPTWRTRSTRKGSSTPSIRRPLTSTPRSCKTAVTTTS